MAIATDEHARRRYSSPAAARSGWRWPAARRFGIDCVVVEKSPTTTDHPKSRGCWVRTMEIFRQWGIETAHPRPRPAGQLRHVRFLESIAGHEIGRTGPSRMSAIRRRGRAWWRRMRSRRRSLRVVERVEARVPCCSAPSVNWASRKPTAASGSRRALRRPARPSWHATYLIAADGAGSRPGATPASRWSDRRRWR